MATTRGERTAQKGLPTTKMPVSSSHRITNGIRQQQTELHHLRHAEREIPTDGKSHMTRARDEESEPVVRTRGDFAPSAVVRENLYLTKSFDQLMVYTKIKILSLFAHLCLSKSIGSFF